MCAASFQKYLLKLICCFLADEALFMDNFGRVHTKRRCTLRSMRPMNNSFKKQTQNMC